MAAHGVLVAQQRGASAKGARGMEILENDEHGRPVRLDGDHPRDEDEQAAHLSELLTLFDEEGVDTAFVYTFANYHLPHRAEPRADLDRAGHGVVKVADDDTGEPKAAFAAVAAAYGD